jgi:hypothetical protein
MNDTTAPKSLRPRPRTVRSPAGRSRARAHGTRLPGQPSPRRQVAAQVVAWHNRHPLARRISRRHLGGYGVVSLPFSPAVDDPAGQGGARYPMFDDLSLIPGLSRSKVVAMALAHGWEERPAPGEWPLREVPVARGWESSQARPIYLLTVALKRGRNKPPLRLLIGRDVVSPDVGSVVGHRLLSRPRMSLVAMVLMLPALLTGWGLKELWPGGRPGLPALPVAQAPGPPADGRGAMSLPPAGSVMPRGNAPTAAPPFPAPATTPSVAGGPPVPAGAGYGAGPRVGAGVPLQGQETRAAGPSAFWLRGEPQADPAVLQLQVKELRAALDAMGRTGGRVRIDVMGTATGDALSVGPLPDQADAERVARRLAAHGINFSITEQ